jgi:hypothetical protein
VVWALKTFLILSHWSRLVDGLGDGIVCALDGLPVRSRAVGSQRGLAGLGQDRFLGRTIEVDGLDRVVPLALLAEVAVLARLDRVFEGESRRGTVRVSTRAASKNFSSDLHCVKSFGVERRDVDIDLCDQALQSQVIDEFVEVDPALVSIGLQARGEIHIAGDQDLDIGNSSSKSHSSSAMLCRSK